MKNSCTIACGMTVMLFSATCLAADGDNIALGKSYTFSSPPNYALCTDDGDATDLTDGRYITDPQSGYWTEKGTVGWSHPRDVQIITIDLETVQPIRGVRFYTAAGGAGVTFPSMIELAVSEDGETFYPAGELYHLSDAPLPPAYGAFALATLSTDALRTKGRYVQLAINAVNSYLFMDEIEVIAGASSWIDLPYPEPAAETAPRDLRLTRQGVYLRIRRDIEALQALMPDNDALIALRQEVNTLSYPDAVEGFRAIAPIGDPHGRVLAEHGKWLASRGYEPLTVWTSDPYQLMSLLIEPQDSADELAVRLMNGERRPAVFNLTNASDQPRTVRFAIEDLPGGVNPDYARMFEVQSVDTRESKVVAAALLPLTARDGVYETTIAAGMTRQIWIAFEPTNVAPGSYDGRIVMNSDEWTTTLPLHMTISPITFPEQVDLTTATWDYVANMSYGVTPSNQQAAAEFIRNDPLLNAVWANPQKLPMPRSCDADGNIGPIDFTRWDEYARMFPNKKLFVFAHFNVNTSFMSLQQATPQFDRAIGQWAVAWAEHNRELGLEPGQAGILFIDEPGNSEWFKATWHFSKPFNDATDDILVFNDPSGHHLNEDYGSELIQASDILCPTLAHLDIAAANIQQRLSTLPSEGRALWLYMCSGPTRHYDPSYFRMQAWQVFRYNGNGSGFWAWGDTGGATSSWNGYPTTGRTSYEPAYIDTTSIATSKQYEAMRDGAMDYQYLVMLRQRVAELEAAGVDTDALRQARAFVHNGVENLIHDVTEIYGQYYINTWGNQCAMADDARLVLLDHLESLIHAH